jgi:hypothetical protein
MLVSAPEWGDSEGWDSSLPVYDDGDVVWTSGVREVGVDIAAAAYMRMTCRTGLRHFHKFRI